MAQGKPHTPDTHAAVVADLLTGMSARAAAKAHGVSVATVLGWARSLDQAAIARRAVLAAEPAPAPVDWSALVEDYLAALLGTLATQARLFTDRDWLFTHSPADAATLHGVMADKALRIIAGAQVAQSQRPALPPPTVTDTDAIQS